MFPDEDQQEKQAIIIAEYMTYSNWNQFQEK